MDHEDERVAHGCGPGVLPAPLAHKSKRSHQRAPEVPVPASTLQEPEPEGRREGPEQNISFQKFVSGSVSLVTRAVVARPDARRPAREHRARRLSITHLDQLFTDNANQSSASPPIKGSRLAERRNALGGPCIPPRSQRGRRCTSWPVSRSASASMNQFFGLPSPLPDDRRVGTVPDGSRGSTSTPRPIAGLSRSSTSTESEDGAFLKNSSGPSPSFGYEVHLLGSSSEKLDGDQRRHQRDAGAPGLSLFRRPAADRRGRQRVRISTNEFPISGPGFNGAQVYGRGQGRPRWRWHGERPARPPGRSTRGRHCLYRPTGDASAGVASQRDARNSGT